MTKAQAVSVAGDLVNAGYDANATQRDDNSWVVRGSSRDGVVDAQTVASFATAHGVSAKVDTVEFV